MMTNKQKDMLFAMAVIWFLIGFFVAVLCDARASNKKPDVALWLARACVGEAGWKSTETGECAAIAHVFHKRSYWQPKRDYFKAMFDYSAALRVGYKTRPWLLNLKRSGKRPRLLESNTCWEKHRKYWMDTLDFADRFFNGRIPDPTPKALHFGGKMDIENIDPEQWVMMDTPFRNKFFRKREE